MRTRILFGLAAALVASVAIGAGDETARPTPAAGPNGKPVACGPGGVEVTVALDYDRDQLGLIAATRMDLEFRKPLALPTPSTPEKLRSRLTSLLSSEYRVALAKQDGAGKLRVALTTSDPGLPATNAFKMRFDCPSGAQVRDSELSCATAEVVDGAGIPMAETLAHGVRCRVVQVDPVRSE